MSSILFESINFIDTVLKKLSVLGNILLLYP